MGLDICAYSQIVIPRKLVTEKVIKDYFDDSGDVYLYANEHFPEQQDDFLGGGSYDYRGDYHSFRAGSYSYYNEWRNGLCVLAHGITAEQFWNNLEAHREFAFYELINFSDCEGFIGPKTSRKLYKDFVEYEEKAKNTWEEDSWYLEKYLEWKKAFELASDNGAVCFH